MNNPTFILKVPEGLVKKANERGVLNDIIFWYKLKSLKIEGKLYKQDLINKLSKQFNFSFSYIYKKIQKLIKLGYIKEYKLYYQLIKYDNLFAMLGFGVRDKFSYGFINNYKESIKFKIFKIQSNQLNNFIENISYEEIKLNFERQAFQAIKKIKQNKNSLLKTIPKSVLNGVKLKSLNSINLFYNYFIGLNKEKFWNKESDYDITISCLSLSKLLGYNSSQTGFSILYKLEKLGLLFIKTRKVLIEANDYFAKILYDKYKLFSAKYVLESGKLYYYNTNKIILY